jgi:hypothetical protein
VTVTSSGAPVGSTVMAALLDVPQLPTPDTNAVGSFAETAPLSGIWTFTPSASRYGKFRIRVVATLPDLTTQVEDLTFVFLSPAGAMEVPALNERGDKTASLVNQGATVLANTESNVGPGGTGFRAWHRWILRISKLVEDLVAGGGGGGSGVGGFHFLPAGEQLEVAEGQQLMSEGRVVVEGGITLDGGWSFARPHRPPVVTRLVGAETFQAPGGRDVVVPCDPTSGAATVKLPNRAEPGDTYLVLNDSDSVTPITVEAVGGRINGVPSKLLNTAREHLRVRRGPGWDWSVVS